MSVGRKSSYSKEVLEKSRRYLETFADYGHAIPSIAGLSVVLKVSRDTVYRWSKDKDKKPFSYILEQILSTQELLLVNKGLMNEFNSNIVKLALGKHGYSERQNLDHTSSDNSMSPQVNVYIPDNDRD